MPTITLYPQYGSAGVNTLTALAKANAQTVLASKEVSHAKDIGNLKISALEAIHEKELENEELKGQLVYGNQRYTPYAAGMAMPYGYGAGYPGGILGSLWGGLAGGYGVPGQVVGLPGGFPGTGQANITSQVGSGTQTVTNSNQFINNVMLSGGGWGGGFPFGGLIRRFLGGW